MPHDELPLADVSAGVERLIRAYGNPYQGVSAAEFAKELRKATRGWSLARFTDTLEETIRSVVKFPSVAMILQHRPALRQQAQPWRGDVCVSCDRHYFYAGFLRNDGTIGPRLRCDCAQPSTRWEDDRAMQWDETDADLIRDGYGTPPTRQDWAA